MAQNNSNEQLQLITDTLTQQVTTGLQSAATLLNELRKEVEKIKVQNEGIRVGLERMDADVGVLNRIVQGNGQQPLLSRIQSLEEANARHVEMAKDLRSKKAQIYAAIVAGTLGIVGSVGAVILSLVVH